MNQTLEEIVKQHVNLGAPNSKGWYPCVHIGGCDQGHKGPRAAFKFSDQTVAFHCFNCGIGTVYDPTTHETMPEKMQTVLHNFSVPEEDWRQVVFSALGKSKKAQAKHDKPIQNIEPKELQIPQPFKHLHGCSTKWATIASYYLSEQRNIDPLSYPFMICDPKADEKLFGKWKKRLIIPIYKNNKTVFWQGRALTDNIQPKYLSPGVPKERVIYGYDQIFKHTPKPLYIVEGWFDAFKIDGIALLGNEITSEQIKWINKSSRPKVYIPDRFGNGKRTATRALDIGWKISTPEIGNCKDMSDAVDRYGLIYVIKTITENTHNDLFTAQTQLNFYCTK